MDEKYKILLADDEPQNLRCLFDALSVEDYLIITAPNGKVAVEQSVKHLPDAIVMDWEMPVMDGIEAIKLLREKEETKYIPIIMATGKMTSTENLKSALSAGANDYIRKPFDNIEIIARVNSMIKHNIEHKKNMELQKQIAEQKIANLKAELSRNASALSVAKLRMIENGEFSSQLIGDLEELRNCVPESGSSVISKIISYCKANENGVNWNEFEMLFEKVHQSFYTKLQDVFPDLTSNERKLCAMIKLNLTTKEIAAVTNKNVDAIKKAKNRLKMKYEIGNIESLYNIVQNLN